MIEVSTLFKLALFVPVYIVFILLIMLVCARILRGIRDAQDGE